MYSCRTNQIQIFAILDAATKISLIAKYIYFLETQHFDSRYVFNPVMWESQFEELCGLRQIAVSWVIHISLSDDWPYWNGTISPYFLHSVHLLNQHFNLDLLFFFNTVIHLPIPFTVLKILPHNTIFSLKFLTVHKRDWENCHSTIAMPSVAYVNKKGVVHVLPLNG